MKNPKGKNIPKKNRVKNKGKFYTGKVSQYDDIKYNKELNKLIEQKATEFRKDLIKRCTNAEKKFRSFLERQYIKYEFQKIIFIRDNDANIIKFFIADFYLKDYKVIIEIDGGYHTSAIQQEYDINRDFLIKKSYPNISIIRITNEQVNDVSYISGVLDTYKFSL